MPVDILRGQIDAVVEDIGADAVKIGMLATPEVVRVVADAIRRHQLRNVVLDPVMVATSGDRLIAPETASVLVRELFPLATVVTPNLDEAALLLGHAIDGVDALDGAVQELLALGAPAALLKGGHLSGDLVVDLLGHGNGQRLRLQSPRIATHNGHGTGCTLSSAIASHLALGLPLEAAVAQAREYILGAIAAGADVFTGAGHGPLNHGYAPRAQVVIG
jgi:hydroxymethylpyrimidine/phosphomethylpyrimidine kinase